MSCHCKLLEVLRENESNSGAVFTRQVVHSLFSSQNEIKFGSFSILPGEKIRQIKYRNQNNDCLKSFGSYIR